MTYCPHEEEYKGYTIRILLDENPPNPRKEQDNLGTFIVWSPAYHSPDPTTSPTSKSSTSGISSTRPSPSASTSTTTAATTPSTTTPATTATTTA